MEKLNDLIIKSNFAHKEMKIVNHSSEKRWEEKKVYESITLYKSNTLENVTLPKNGTISLSKEIALNDSSLCVKVDTNVEGISPRPSCGFYISFKEMDLTSYNRLSFFVYPKATGYQNFYFHFSLGNSGQEELHAPSLTPNVWNHVIWEINKVPRDKVSKISISPFLGGCPPEATPSLEAYISDIEAQKVDAEYEEGWDTEDRIAYCHSGYLQNSKKIALTGKANDSVFYIYNTDDALIYKKEIKKESNNLGTFYVCDFSEIKAEGTFYLKIDDRKTNPFPISNKAYDSSIWKSLSFLRSLRCGQDIDGVHSACHLNCRTVHEDGRSVPNFGGWHDAGDLSQFEICTAEMAHALLDLALKEKDDEFLFERILEEAKVGLSWLLQTRFNDGQRSLAVSYSSWRSNILLPDNKSILISKAENGPFENLLAAAAEAKGAILFKEIDEVFSLWCERCAIEDFDFGVDGLNKGIYTKRWGPSITPQVNGVLALAACELYNLTKDEKYMIQGTLAAEKIIRCQDTSSKIKGFFYEDEKHTKILAYEHRGHEQSPIQGLVMLCLTFPNHKDYPKWRESISFYKNYILQTSTKVYPYNLIPAHVYDPDKINLDHYTIPTKFADTALDILKAQITAGEKIDNNLYLRIFPIAIQRRGYHATLLSKTKAISMIAKLEKDDKLKQIAVNQLEWILGKNPFSSSTMYGEGYNYHPLYVAYSKQMIGALPVGIKTYNDHDKPYWPVINNAVYKEIWGHTTGKYLWVLADIL